MATSGSFTTSTQSLDFKINWSRTDSGINSSGVGYSVISINVTCTRTNWSYEPYKQSTPYTFTYDSTNANGTMNFKSSGYQTGVENSLYTTSITVLHDSNGNRTVPLKFVLDLSGTSAGVVTIQGDAVLDNIPLASTLSSISNVAFNSTSDKTLSFTPRVYKSSYTHTIQLKVGSTSVYGPSSISLTNGTQASLSLAAATWIPKIPTNTSSVTATIVLTTYSGSTVIGNAQSYNFSVSTSIGPTVSLSSVTSTSSVNANYYTGVSKAVLSAGANPRYGETISSIAFYQNNTLLKTYTFSGSGNKSQSHTTGVLSGTSRIDFKIVVTDSRGVTTTSSIVSVTPIAYSVPTITTASAVRCTSAGTADSAGTYIRATVAASANGSGLSISTRKLTTYNSSGSSVNSANLDNNTATTIGSGNYSITQTYTAKFEVTDSLGGKSTATVSIPTASRIINVHNTGDGIAFNTFAEAGKLKSEWPIVGSLGFVKNIGSSDNLNNILKFGKYAEPSSGSSYMPTNVPSGLTEAFVLYVISANGSANMEGTWKYCNQIIKPISGNTIWSRMISIDGSGNLSYGSWTNLVFNGWRGSDSATGEWDLGVMSAKGYIYFYANGTTGARGIYKRNSDGSSVAVVGAGDSGNTFYGNATGTAANVTGTVAIANGGTGATSAAGARTNLGLFATLLSNGITTGSTTIGDINTYKVLIFLCVVDTSSSEFITVTVPRAVIGTSASKWCASDAGYWYTFTLANNDGTLTVAYSGRNKDGKIGYIYGVK